MVIEKYLWFKVELKKYAFSTEHSTFFTYISELRHDIHILLEWQSKFSAVRDIIPKNHLMQIFLLSDKFSWLTGQKQLTVLNCQPQVLVHNVSIKK